MGILSLIPLKDWIYGVAIVAILTFGGIEIRKHNIREQKLGEQLVLAQNATAAAKAEKQVAAGTATASTTEASNAKRFEESDLTPITPVGLLCKRTAPAAGGKLPETSPGHAPGADLPGADSGVGPAFDPTVALLERARAADAQIAYLQGRVKELEEQMRNSP